ncbi:MAG: S8/S53 family peptidase [Pseudomonadota bacterium]
MKRVQWGVVMAAGLLLAACGGGGGDSSAAMAPKQTAETTPTATATGSSRVVVAVIDSAINPYHEALYAGGSLYPGSAPRAVTSAVLAEFGIDASHILNLTRTGNFAADVAADAAQWRKVRRGERYWVRGTNLILVSFDDSGLPLLQPTADKDPHGVGTSSAMLAAAPQSVLVFVEGTTADAEAFAFTHPAIDIVSTSYGTPGSIPLASQPLTQSLEGVVTQGKLHVGAADNSPALATFDGTAGPWWSVGIAGLDVDSQGRELVSGTFPDFLAAFTQTLPYCTDCETGLETVSGTSFATPQAAGVAASILLQTRTQLGHVGGIVAGAQGPVMVRGGGREISVWQLRRALEQAAAQVSITDYQPSSPTAIPVLPVLPALQTGWGVLTPDSASGVVARGVAVLTGVQVADTTPAGTCDVQTGLMQLRRNYWDRLNPLSPSFMNSPASFPVIGCGSPLEQLP